MSQDILIATRGLYRYYNGLCAVEDLNMEVCRGQVLGFLGPNGAGKSTTMRILAGCLAPSAGEVRVNGYDLLDHPIQARAGIGYLPEQPPIYRELRVDEYLRFCARLRGLSRADLAPTLARVTRQCGLEQVSRRLIGNLSKGYQQRVGIAQAILHNPAVVILDEPTVGLDPIQIREIRALIRDLGNNHSVILSTHILSEVQTICNHVQIIHRGQLVLNDTIEGLQQKMHSTTLIVGWRCPPSRETLLALPGLEEVEQIDALHWRIRHDAAQNPAEMLVEKSVSGGWGLFELTPEQRSLEQLFVELTVMEQSGVATPDISEAA